MKPYESCKTNFYFYFLLSSLTTLIFFIHYLTIVTILTQYQKIINKIDTFKRLRSILKKYDKFIYSVFEKGGREEKIRENDGRHLISAVWLYKRKEND